mmetsp:Transcript_15731/g.34118  ORF Transcript_15731/g.34118 Transcript_15731/m.34118 type:complete len:224 (-) Transcript_15731:610-1281(-)
MRSAFDCHQGRRYACGLGGSIHSLAVDIRHGVIFSPVNHEERRFSLTTVEVSDMVDGAVDLAVCRIGVDLVAISLLFHFARHRDFDTHVRTIPWVPTAPLSLGVLHIAMIQSRDSTSRVSLHQYAVRVNAVILCHHAQKANCSPCVFNCSSLGLVGRTHVIVIAQLAVVDRHCHITALNKSHGKLRLAVTIFHISLEATSMDKHCSRPELTIIAFGREVCVEV